MHSAFPGFRKYDVLDNFHNTGPLLAEDHLCIRSSLCSESSKFFF